MNVRFGHGAHDRAAGVLHALLGNEIAIEAGPLEVSTAGILPLELPAVANALPARKREFATGRMLARRAMAQLHWPKMAIPQAADRAPIWPRGVVGSISHSRSVCIVAVARATHLSALGIDIEPTAPLEPDLADIICTRSELNWLDTQDQINRGLLGKVIFSAKEATYKCQYLHSQAMLDFHDLNITLDLSAHKFTARFRTNAPPFAINDALIGRFAMDSDHIITTQAMPAKECAA